MSDEPEYGPAMAALTERQRAFVEVLLDNPGIVGHRATEMAGYRNSPGGHRVRAHHLLHDDRIIAAVHEQAGRRLRSHALMAADVVVKLLGSEDEKIQMKAAQMLLDRVGFGPQTTLNVNQTVTDQSGKAIMERIRALAERHGLDAHRLLGAPPAKAGAIDGEFSEVGGG